MEPDNAVYDHANDRPTPSSGPGPVDGTVDGGGSGSMEDAEAAGTGSKGKEKAATKGKGKEATKGKGKAATKGKAKAKEKGKKGEKEWVTVVRNTYLQREAASLMAAFSAVVEKRRQLDLQDFLHALCSGHAANTTDWLGNIIQSPRTGTSNSDSVICALTSCINRLKVKSKILDFQRMMLMIQLALAVDWYVFFPHYFCSKLTLI